MQPPSGIPVLQMDSNQKKAKISMGGSKVQVMPPKESIMPEGALAVDEDEFEEILEDGTVIKKKVITTRTATTVTKTIISVMPDGSISEEVITEDISGPGDKQPVSDEIIPDIVSRVPPKPEAPQQPIEDDLIVPDDVIHAESAPPGASPGADDSRVPVDESEIIPEVKKGAEELPPMQPPVSYEPPLSPTEFDEVEETLPDGTVVKRRAIKTKVKKVITKKIRRVGPDGEVIEDVFTEEVPESDLSETSSIRSSLSDARDVVSPVPYVSSPAGLASPAESIDSEKPSVRVYTDTIEGEPQVETDVQEFEETMPDGTIVKRKVIKTRQKQTIVKRVVMEGPENDLPTTEEQAQMMLNTAGSFEPEVQVYTDRMQTEPTESTNVQEFEETMPDGTVVKKKVVTTTEQQLKTDRTIMEGTGAVVGLTDNGQADGDIPIDDDLIDPEHQSYAESAPPGRSPQAGI